MTSSCSASITPPARDWNRDHGHRPCLLVIPGPPAHRPAWTSPIGPVSSGPFPDPPAGASGYRFTREDPHHSFGHDLVGETWELTL
jgi:hypothetical protein